jgi:hypothetical protein
MGHLREAQPGAARHARKAARQQVLKEEVDREQRHAAHPPALAQRDADERVEDGEAAGKQHAEGQTQRRLSAQLDDVAEPMVLNRQKTPTKNKTADQRGT